MEILKTVDLRTDGGVSAEQLEAINRYTRRPLEEHEVFVFSVVLCDNEVDRDWERFDDEALERLGELYLGKTGVFDHSPKAEKQSARIFATQVMGEDRLNSLGEPYRALRGWAYMVRCDKNADLILEIDAGIKKEVSVGCSVERVLCSVCGRDQRERDCVHCKGQRTDGQVCHHVLSGPTDAYEWSFVAVPAQKNAGVIKRYASAGVPGGVELGKVFGADGDITLSGEQRKALRHEVDRLRELADVGQERMEELRRDVVKLALLCQPEMEPGVMEEVAAGMDARQLKAFQKAYAHQVRGRYPVPQLADPDMGQKEPMGAYKI